MMKRFVDEAYFWRPPPLLWQLQSPSLVFSIHLLQRQYLENGCAALKHVAYLT